MAKMTNAASHSGTCRANGPSHKRNKQSNTSGTFTNASPSSRMFRTRRGFSRNTWMNLVNAE